MIRINNKVEGYIIKKGIIRKKYLLIYLILIFLLYIPNLNNNLFKLIFKFNFLLSFYFYYDKEIYKNLLIETMIINFEKRSIEINSLNDNTYFDFSKLNEVKIIKTQDTFDEISFYSLEIKVEENFYNFGSELTIDNLKKIQKILQNEVIEQYVKI